MASDSNQYERALTQWHELRKQREFSVPSNIGTVAIFYTQAVYDSRLFEGGDSESVREKELEMYKDEAYIISDALYEEGYDVELIEGPTKLDFFDVLDDRRVSSVITIGSGSLQSLILDVKDNDIIQTVTWRDVARTMSHLKLGFFEQRQCGHIMPKCAAIPLGVLAMAEFSSVSAAAGEYFTPEVAYGNNDKIRQITTMPFLTYKEIQVLCRDLGGDETSLDPTDDE
jgi:hypothetical protein